MRRGLRKVQRHVRVCGDCRVSGDDTEGVREHGFYTERGPLVSVDGKPGPSIGARIRPWAKLNVRPRSLAAEDQAS